MRVQYHISTYGGGGDSALSLSANGLEHLETWPHAPTSSLLPVARLANAQAASHSTRMIAHSRGIPPLNQSFATGCQSCNQRQTMRATCLVCMPRHRCFVTCSYQACLRCRHLRCAEVFGGGLSTRRRRCCRGADSRHVWLA